MSSHVIDQPLRTEAISGGWDQFHPASGANQSIADRSKESFVVTLVAVNDHYLISGGTLAQHSLLDGTMLLAADATTSNKPLLLMRRPEVTSAAPSVLGKVTTAQSAVGEIRAISGLTN